MNRLIHSRALRTGVTARLSARKFTSDAGVDSHNGCAAEADALVSFMEVLPRWYPRKTVDVAGPLVAAIPCPLDVRAIAILLTPEHLCAIAPLNDEDEHGGVTPRERSR